MKQFIRQVATLFSLIVMVNGLSGQDIDLDGDIVMKNYTIKDSISSFGIYEGDDPQVVLHDNGELDVTKRINIPSSSGGRIFQLTAEGATFTLRDNGDYKLGYYGSSNEWGPTFTDSINLGTARYRWKTVHGIDADFSGELETSELSIDGSTFPPSGAVDGHVLKYNTGSMDWMPLEDDDPSNEIQTISKSGSSISLSNGGGTISDVDDWSNSGSDIYYNSGNVGLGTASPDGSLGIHANSSSSLPHISLYEEGVTDFTRLKMRNNVEGDNYWTMAARVAKDGAPENALINFYYNDGTFNVFQVFGNGDAVFKGDLTVNGVSYPSDINLKRDIHPISNWADIYKLNGYTYHWKRDGESNLQNLQHGVIAQEIQVLFPSLVKENREGNLSVNYNDLIPIMIEALKSQNRKIDSFANELDTIKKQLDKL